MMAGKRGWIRERTMTCCNGVQEWVSWKDKVVWWMPGLGRSPEGGYWRWRGIKEVDEEVKDLNTGWVTCVDFAVTQGEVGRKMNQKPCL